ncbi:MAG: TonB-dependent receptor [Acidobacteriia bacterium]|nr:TonB-dependent receptor [Terriglobia bacterium]
MRLRLLVLLLLAVLTICPPSELTAQTTTSGALAGVVTDQSNAVIAGADVEIRDNAKGATQSTRTDRQGVYRFLFLLPGTYTLTVTHAGFRERRRTVDVLLGPAVSVNVSLAIATPATEITVADEVPLLQAESGDFSTAINREQISDLPNSGNDLTYIAQTAPGVVMNTDGGAGNFSSLGMPGTSNLFTLNGMNENDMGVNLNQTGPLGPMLGQNEIQEATVVTNGYSGQFGTLAGTNVSFITKSGSNGFHGNAKYFWNGRVLNANDWINKAFVQPRPFAIANQWAGSVGGPLRKDKLFFFFNSEGLQLTLPLIFPTVVPSTEFEVATMANIDKKFGPTSASHDFYQRIFDLYNAARGTNAVQPGGFFEADKTGCDDFLDLGIDSQGNPIPCAVNFVKNETQPIYESLISGRVDWNAASKDRVFLLVQYDHGINRFVDPISPLFNIETDQPWWQGQLVHTHALGVSAANQFVLGGWWRSAIFKPKNLAQTQAAFPTRLGWCDGGSCSFNNLGLSLGGPVGTNNTQWQIADDLSGIRASHKLGIGINFLRGDHNDFFYSGNSAGDILPFSLDAFYQGGFDANGGEADFSALNQSFAQARSQRVAFYNLGVYAQDEWRARPNLAVTLALRIEHQSNPVCADRCFARLAGPFESVSHDPNQPYNEAILINQRKAYPELNSILWAPRISFAWQPFGVLHNMVLRGGIGMFYDSLPGALAESLTVNPPLNNQFTVINNNIARDETNSLFRDAENSNEAFLNAFSGGNQIPGFSPAFTNPSRKMLSPQYQKWSLELQQVFGINTSLSIGYFGNHGIHELIQNTSANAYGFGSLPQAECTTSPVPPCADPRFSTVNSMTSVGVSNYHGVVTSFKHRFVGRSQGLLQANYTYGRAFDEGSNGGLLLFVTGAGGYAINPQDPNNPRGAYGPADYDIRHSFNANYIWEIPVKILLGNRGPDHLVTGWQISGTLFARGGFRYTVYDNLTSGVLSATKNFGGQLYAVPAHPLGKQLPCGRGAVIPAVPRPCQTPLALTLPSGALAPNLAADFIQPGCITDFNTGTLPNPSDPLDPWCGGPSVSFSQGRNRFYGPSYFSADLTIMKNTRLPGWENGQFGIGFQFFNVFNHPNFGMPDGFSSSSTFGQIIYTASPPTGVYGRGLSARMIQVKAQVQF